MDGPQTAQAKALERAKRRPCNKTGTKAKRQEMTAMRQEAAGQARAIDIIEKVVGELVTEVAKQHEVAQRREAKAVHAGQQVSLKAAIMRERILAREEAAKVVKAAKEQAAKEAKEAKEARGVIEKVVGELVALVAKEEDARGDKRLITSLFELSMDQDGFNTSSLSKILMSLGAKNCSPAALGGMQEKGRLSSNQREAILNAMPTVTAMVNSNRLARLRREEAVIQHALHQARQQAVQQAWQAAHDQEQKRQREERDRKQARLREQKKDMEERQRDRRRQETLVTTSLKLCAHGGEWLGDVVILAARQPIELLLWLPHVAPTAAPVRMVVSLEYANGTHLQAENHSIAVAPTKKLALDVQGSSSVRLTVRLATTSQAHGLRQFRLKVQPALPELVRDYPGLIAATGNFALVTPSSMDQLRVALAAHPLRPTKADLLMQRKAELDIQR